MRTTLTIDDDIALKLKRMAGSRSARFKVLVNEVLRAGVEASEAPKRRRKYRTRTHSLGLRPGLDPFKLGQLADELSDTEKVRKSG